MSFPIYYNGKILFVNGMPAFSTNCCCGRRRDDTTCCCGDTIEVEYELYDQTNTTLIFTGSFSWPLGSAWSNPLPSLRVGIGTLNEVSGSYRVTQSGEPNVTCANIGVTQICTMSMQGIFGLYFNDVAYDTQNVVHSVVCEQLGNWSAWTQDPGISRYRIRLI
jgi:hypothetical protein